jgi:hypothetical protein
MNKIIAKPAGKKNQKKTSIGHDNFVSGDSYTPT